MSKNKKLTVDELVDMVTAETVPENVEFSGAALIPDGGYESLPSVAETAEELAATLPPASSTLSEPFAAIEAGWTFSMKAGVWTVMKPDGSKAQGKTVEDAMQNFDLQRVPETAVGEDGKAYMTGRTLVVRPDGSIV